MDRNFWLSTFREFVGYDSKLCGLCFATSLSHKSVGGEPQSSSDGNTHVNGTHGRRMQKCSRWGGRAYCPESSRMSCLTFRSSESDRMPQQGDARVYVPRKQTWCLFRLKVQIKMQKIRQTCNNCSS